jgi:shikimate kinase
LAELTGFAFVDSDQEICHHLHCSIAEVVEQQGWEFFREQERLFLKRIPSLQQTVVAVGGGAILHQQEWQALRPHAWIVWLRTDLSTTLARLKQDVQTRSQRPALHQNHDLAKESAHLLAQREPLYRAGSDTILDTEEQRPEDLAALLWQQWQHLKPS